MTMRKRSRYTFRLRVAMMEKIADEADGLDCDQSDVVREIIGFGLASPELMAKVRQRIRSEQGDPRESATA